MTIAARRRRVMQHFGVMISAAHCRLCFDFVDRRRVGLAVRAGGRMLLR